MKIIRPVEMIGHRCFTHKLKWGNIRTVTKWFFWKKKIAECQLVFTQCPAETISQKINCEC